jgi:hypothetical protein
VFAYCGRTAKLLWTSSSRADGFGTVIVPIGDMNADEIGEIVVGTPDTMYGGADVLSGCDGRILWHMPPGPDDWHFGFSAVALGDIDGDHVGDFALTRIANRNAEHPGLIRFYSGAGAKRAQYLPLCELDLTRARALPTRSAGADSRPQARDDEPPRR